MAAQTRAMLDHVDDVAASLRAAIPAPSTPAGRPAVLMLMGFPGAGKSHVARLLAARLGAAHVASDHLRSQLFVAPSYAKEESAAVFAVIDDLVRALLADGHRVIVDATNLRRPHRAGVEGVARELGAPLVHVLVSADEAEILGRLAARRRQRAAGDHSDADERVYGAMRSRGFEEPADGHIVLRNGPGADVEVERVARSVEEGWS